MKKIIVLPLSVFLAATGCTIVETKEPIDNTTFPQTLDSCISRMQDQGDIIYNKEVEIRLLKEEIIELKKSKVH